MKKLLISLLIITLYLGKVNAQFSENVGTGSGTTGINSYTGWQNNATNTFSGTGDVRSTTPSSGYLGSSGNGNVFLTNSGTATLLIANINTLSLTNPTLEIGLIKSTTASNALELVFQYSIDGTTFTQILTPTQTTGSGSAVWRKVRFTGLPQTANLRIRFTNSGTSPTFRIDDIVVNALATLPITLISFTGKEANKSIVLNWITASEKNNKNFEILRSVDGKNFKTIGSVNGAGDSDAELKYSFTDINPFGGTNYYQLKQIDFDGKNATSPTIAVDSKIAETQITVYVASSSVNIGITSPNEGNGKLSLFDISGRKITEKNISLNKGYNFLELNETLTLGVHFVTLENEGKLHRLKFIK